MLPNVLVLDDEYMIAKLVATKLREIDCYSIIFDNALDALDYIQNNSVDLVISDIYMPEMHGFNFLFRVKQISPDVPVIFLTAKKIKESEISAGSFQPAAYISKPFRTDDLLKMVKKQLSINEKDKN